MRAVFSVIQVVVFKDGHYLFSQVMDSSNLLLRILRISLKAKKRSSAEELTTHQIAVVIEIPICGIF